MAKIVARTGQIGLPFVIWVVRIPDPVQVPMVPRKRRAPIQWLFQFSLLRMMIVIVSLCTVASLLVALARGDKLDRMQERNRSEVNLRNYLDGRRPGERIDLMPLFRDEEGRSRLAKIAADYPLFEFDPLETQIIFIDPYSGNLGIERGDGGWKYYPLSDSMDIRRVEIRNRDLILELLIGEEDRLLITPLGELRRRARDPESWIRNAAPAPR